MIRYLLILALIIAKAFSATPLITIQSDTNGNVRNTIWRQTNEVIVGTEKLDGAIPSAFGDIDRYASDHLGEVVNVLNFSGIYNDDSGDSTVQLQAIINYAVTNTTHVGIPIVIPSGHYIITNTLIVTNADDSERTVKIHFGDVYITARTTNAPLFNVTRSGVELTGTVTVDGDAPGITVLRLGGHNLVQHCLFGNFNVDNVSTGIHLYAFPSTNTGIYYNRFQRFKGSRMNAGIVIESQNPQVAQQANANTFDYISISQTTNYGVYINGGGGNVFHYSHIEDNPTAIAAFITNSVKTDFIGGWWENNLETLRALGDADIVGSIYIGASTDAFHGNDTNELVFDRSIGLARTIQLKRRNAIISWGLERMAGTLRIGEDGEFANDQDNFQLEIPSGFLAAQHSDGAFWMRGITGLRGFRMSSGLNGVTDTNLMELQFTPTNYAQMKMREGTRYYPQYSSFVDTNTGFTIDSDNIASIRIGGGEGLIFNGFGSQFSMQFSSHNQMDLGWTNAFRTGYFQTVIATPIAYNSTTWNGSSNLVTEDAARDVFVGLQPLSTELTDIDTTSPGANKYYGTDGTGTKGFYSITNNYQYVTVTLTNVYANIATGQGHNYYIMPVTGTVRRVWANLTQASSAGQSVFDINLAGSTIMASTKITIGAVSNVWSGAYETQPVLTTSNFNAGQVFTFDIDSAGTDAKGAQIVMEWYPR